MNHMKTAFILDTPRWRVIGYANFLTTEELMASKDGKLFDTIVMIGLGVNGLMALYLLLMYFEVI